MAAETFQDLVDEVKSYTNDDDLIEQSDIKISGNNALKTTKGLIFKNSERFYRETKTYTLTDSTSQSESLPEDLEFITSLYYTDSNGKTYDIGIGRVDDMLNNTEFMAYLTDTKIIFRNSSLTFTVTMTYIKRVIKMTGEKKPAEVIELPKLDDAWVYFVMETLTFLTIKEPESLKNIFTKRNEAEKNLLNSLRLKNKKTYTKNIKRMKRWF